MKLVPLIITGAFLISSCSTNKELACPDLRNNRSYSKKYIADNKLKKNLHKNHSVKRINYNTFQINNLQKYRIKNLRDYTINTYKTYKSETIPIKSIPGITEIQIPTGRNEKF